MSNPAPAEVLELYPQESKPRTSAPRFIGNSPAVKEVFRVVNKVAKSTAGILITGESGTGKELIAAAIHKASLRSGKRLVTVNCAAIHENLLESELFGHVKGAFTGAVSFRTGKFERADEGTLFLDEIGEMAIGSQAKVLRVLQEKEYERLGGNKTFSTDVRIIAATNRNLEDAIAAKEFREDLYYRLNVITLCLPPLRERREDIPLLVRYFIKRAAINTGCNVDSVSPEAMQLLVKRHWPGNVRELQNCIERAVLMCEGSQIEAADLYFAGKEKAQLATGLNSAEAIDLKSLPPGGVKLIDMERKLIVETLKHCDWMQREAALMLGITPRVMNYKIKTHGITHTSWIKNK